MKRNMEIIKDILLDIEEFHKGKPINLHAGPDDPYTNEEFIYHIKLMIDFGLIDADVHSYMGGHQTATIKGITWAGHDFLDSARNPDVWNQANKEAESKGSKLNDLPIEIVKALLIEASKKIFGLS
jgi:hypothetical protein